MLAYTRYIPRINQKGPAMVLFLLLVLCVGVGVDEVKSAFAPVLADIPGWLLQPLQFPVPPGWQLQPL